MQRAHALDALRGFAVLAMVLSGVIPRKILSASMYHAQLPPPNHAFNPQLPGLTWVDLVFPIFLFSLGAAIPLSLSRRLENHGKILPIILGIGKRGLLLATFAILLQHIRPLTLNPTPTSHTWWSALIGFILLILMYIRWPINWSRWLRIMLTGIAWLIGVNFFFNLTYPDGSIFSVTRSDIILIVLANMSVWGAIAWLFTKSNLWLRLGLLGLLFACFLSAKSDGWIKLIWSWSPAPWLFRFDYLKYLFIVIPGTIAGDLIYRWLTAKDVTENPEKPPRWRLIHYGLILILMLSLTAILLIGLQGRLLRETTLGAVILSLWGLFLLKNHRNPTEKLLNQLYSWGVYWLILGLLFEPYQGGIKKDPSTMSYYFITTAIALFLLIAFTILINVFHIKLALGLLIANGLNPMIGYGAMANVIRPIFALIGWDFGMTESPVIGVFIGLFYTLILAYFVRLFSWQKLFLRT